MSYIMNVTGGMFDYDARIYGYDFDKISEPYVSYLGKSGKLDQLYEAIHIKDSFKKPIFEDSSDSVDKGYRSDNLIDYSSYYQYMLDLKYPFIVMSGEFDARDGAESQYIWMKQLLSLSQQFWN